MTSPAATRNDAGADASPLSSPQQSTPSNRSLSTSTVQSPAVPVTHAVIQRIEFVGNRRIRSDTLKARIFSRDGDNYNEETLRRDFQALWNTQFFEDVKLRVED
jgi:outer membrane protein assembly factor BamA